MLFNVFDKIILLPQLMVLKINYTNPVSPPFNNFYLIHHFTGLDSGCTVVLKLTFRKP